MQTPLLPRRRLALAAVLALGGVSAAQAMQHGAAPMKDMPMQAQPGMASMVEGEVRKIDKAAGKITIRHGEIRHLGMPPMTMVFRVRDPALLDRVQVGDRVDFEVERIGGAMTITRMEPAR